MLRSYGGWGGVKEQLRQGIRIKGDERILGSSDFVMQVLKGANERLKQITALESMGIDIETILGKVASQYGINVECLKSGVRIRSIVKARSVVCYAAVRHLGQSCEEVAKRLHISPSAVCKAVSRGQNILHQKEFERLFPI